MLRTGVDIVFVMRCDASVRLRLWRVTVCVSDYW